MPCTLVVRNHKPPFANQMYNKPNNPQASHLSGNQKYSKELLPTEVSTKSAVEYVGLEPFGKEGGAEPFAYSGSYKSAVKYFS